MPFFIPLVVAAASTAVGAAAKKMQADRAAKANLRAAALARKEYGENYTEAAIRGAKAAADLARAEQISLARGGGTASSQASAIQAASQRQGAVSAQAQLAGARIGEGYAGGIADMMSRRAGIDQNYQEMRNDAENSLIDGAGKFAMTYAGSYGEGDGGGTGSKSGGAKLEPYAASNPSWGRSAPASYSASRNAYGGSGYGAGSGYGTGGGGAPVTWVVDNSDDGLGNIKSDERLKQIYGSGAKITGDAGGPIDDNPHNVGRIVKSDAPKEEKRNIWEKVTEPFGGHFGWTRGIIGDKGADFLNKAMTPPSRMKDFTSEGDSVFSLAGSATARPRSSSYDVPEWEYNKSAMGGSGQIMSDEHSKAKIQKLASENARLTKELAASRTPNVQMGSAVMEDEAPVTFMDGTGRQWKVGPAQMEAPAPQYEIKLGDAVMDEPSPQYEIKFGDAVMERPVTSDKHSKEQIQKLTKERDLAKADASRLRREVLSSKRGEAGQPNPEFDPDIEAKAAEIRNKSTEAATAKVIRDAKERLKKRKVIGFKRLPNGSLDADQPIYANEQSEAARAWSNAPEVGWAPEEVAQYYGQPAPAMSEADRAAEALRRRGIGVANSVAPSPAPAARAIQARPSIVDRKAKLLAELDALSSAPELNLATPKPATSTPSWLMQGELSDERTKDVSHKTSAEVTNSQTSATQRTPQAQVQQPIQYGTEQRPPLVQRDADSSGGIDARRYSREAIERFLARRPDYRLGTDGILRSTLSAEHTMQGVNPRGLPLPQRRELLAPPTRTQASAAPAPAPAPTPAAAPQAVPAPAPASTLTQWDAKKVKSLQEKLAAKRAAEAERKANIEKEASQVTLEEEPPKSDGRSKKIGAKSPAGKVFEKTPAYSYEYKKEFLGQPGTKPGMQVGIMAQDLEKTPAGKTVVGKDKAGIRNVDTDRLTLLQAGAMHDMSARLKALEKRVHGKKRA